MRVGGSNHTRRLRRHLRCLSNSRPATGLATGFAPAVVLGEHSVDDQHTQHGSLTNKAAVPRGSRHMRPARAYVRASPPAGDDANGIEAGMP